MKNSLSKQENMKTLQQRKEISDEVCQSFKKNMFSLMEFVRNYYSLNIREFLQLIGMKPTSGGSYIHWKNNDLSFVNAETIIRFCVVFGLDINELCNSVNQTDCDDTKINQPLAAFTAFNALDAKQKEDFTRAIIKQNGFMLGTENDSSTTFSSIQERNAYIYKSYQEGVSAKTLATNFGLTTYSIYNIISKMKSEEEHQAIQKRNEEVYNLYTDGTPVEELAAKYNLPVDEIQSILEQMEKHLLSSIDTPHADYSQLDKNERNQKILEAYKNGASVGDIALQFNIGTSTAYRIIYTMRDDSQPRLSKQDIDARNQKILEERNNGVSIKNIAAKYGVSTSSVYKLVRSMSE